MARLSSVERRNQIINATLEIVSEKGFGNLTTAEIASRVGLTEGAIFKHFSTKSEILQEVLLHIKRTLLPMASSLAGEDLPPEAKLEKILRAKFNFFSNYPGVPKIIFSEQVHLSDESLREILLATVKGYSRVIHDIILEGIEKGSFRKDIDPALATEAFQGLIQVNVFKWSLSGHAWDLADRVKKIIDFYVKTLRTE
ncbi:MAG: TetR/AcrR family transcriptional regulator [Bacillota bacterium]